MGSDYDSKGPTVTGIAIAFAVLTFIDLLLRLFSRLYVMGKMGVDDYLIIGACLLSWAFIAVTIVAVDNGLGKHINDVEKSQLIPYSFAVWLSSMFYVACLGCVKTSVLFFYMRLDDCYLTRMSIVMIAVVAPQAIANTLTAAFQCSPIRKAWASTIPGKCVNINAYYLANAALNIFTDILTYSLPMKVIFTLRVPRKQKIALGFILCLGLLACVSSIIRITYIPVMLSSPDATYVISEAMYWSVIETNVGIFAASAPSFTAIASRFLPRIIGEYSGRKISGRWHGSSFGRKQESGFSKVREPNTIRMGPYQRREAGTEVRVDHPTNSSIERIIVPEKIMTRTQITTSVDASHYFKDPYRSFDRI